MSTTVLETPKIKTKRREPLKEIDMATTQAQARPAPSGRGRRSTRLSLNQEKNDENAKVVEKKRKAVFDDEDDGFQFKRVTSKKSKPLVESIPEIPQPEEAPPQPSPKRGRPKKQKAETATKAKAKADEAPKRQTRGSKAVNEETQESGPRTRKHEEPEAGAQKKPRKGRPSKSKTEERNGYASPEPQPAAKIALPLDDTPVIQRNKEMRGAGKSGKSSNRRSSLGMRGRRASSLIDSGTSNALPHKEVGTAEFYKHIASDLPEPRRMRQLLTWCSTRAMADKPSGASSDDASARLAARVIQEELLKDFSTNSELSNWFSREDVNPPAVVVKKPNPKNIQNTDKIKELEEQIQRLQRERNSLNALLRSPSIPPIKPSKRGDSHEKTPQPESQSQPEIDRSLLDPTQQEILASIRPDATKHPGEATTSLPMTPATVSSRLSRITTGLGPTLDSFAAGVHEIELYRSMSDTVSSRVLRICAERLDERDARNALQRLAIEGRGEGKEVQRLERPREDLGVILGALSRVERR